MDGLIHRIPDIASYLNIFGTGILAGVLWMSALGLGPASAALGPAQQVILRQQLIKRLRLLMTPFMLLPIVTSGTLLALNGKPGHRAAGTAEFISSVAAVAVTIFVNVPLNWRFADWSAKNLPADWHMYVRQWDRANSIRFVLALAAFACALFIGGK